MRVYIEGDGGGWQELQSEENGTDLFVDRVALSENKVTAEQPRKKGIMWSFLPTVHLPLEEQERFVDRDKFCEIHCVLLCRTEDGFEPRMPTLASSQG